MADDVISVGVDVDISALQSGMSNAASIVRQNLEIVKEQYKAASAEVRQSVQRIVDAEKQHAEATASGYTVIAAVLEKAAAEERTALDGLINDQQRAAASMAQLKAEVASLGGAMGHTVSEVSAASATIRVFEGNMPIRAVERFAVSTLGLGPILQSAFPIIGMIAAGEMLVHVGEKVWHLIDDFINLKEAQEQVHESALRMGAALVSSYEHQQQVIVETLKLQGKIVEAAEKETANLGSKPIDLSKFLKTEEIDKKMKQLPKEMQEQLKNTFTQVIPAELDSKIAQVKAQLAGVAAEAEKIKARDVSPPAEALMAGPVAHPGNNLQMDQTRDLNQQKVAKETYQELIDTLTQFQSTYVSEVQQGGQKITNAHAEVQKKAEQEAKQASSAAMAAARERTQQLRQADQEALSDMQAGQDMTIAKTIAFWQARLAIEAGNAERLREIKQTLGHLYQQQDKEESQGHVKDVNEGAESAKAAGGAIAELHFLEEKAQVLEKLAAANHEYAAALQDVKNKIVAVTPEASNQTEENILKDLEEQFKKLQATQNVTAADTKAFWSDVANSYGTYAKVSAKAVDEVTAAVEKMRAEQKKAQQENIQGDSDKALGGLAMQKLAVQRTQAIGGDDSNAAQVNELQQLRDIDQQIINEKLATARKLQAIDLNDPAKFAEDQKKIIDIQRQGDQQIYQDTTQIIAKQMQSYNNFFAQVNQGFTSSLHGMLTGQQTFSSGMRKLWSELATHFLETIAMWPIKWAEQEMRMTLSTVAGNQAREASNAAAAAQGQTLSMVSAMKQATVAASTAAQNTYSAISAIPYVGPFLAPEAAAGAYAAVIAMSAFETGGYVPNTQVALVHGGEHVITAPLTSMLNDVAKNGGVQGGSHSSQTFGDFHYHAGQGGSSRSQARDIHQQLMDRLRSQNRIPSAKFSGRWR